MPSSINKSNTPSDMSAATLALRNKIPQAELALNSLPQVPEIKLFLLDEHYPQHELSAEAAHDLMDEPPYWAFCWASGQVLARYFLDHPDLVRDKVVLDFGCGSGVVAIAAAKAGALKAIALDEDPIARSIARANADINQVEIQTVGSINQVALAKHTVIAIADVFYDRENLPLLPDLQSLFDDIWVADSRVSPNQLSSLTLVAQFQSHTVPDLDEASAFNQVRLYRSDSPVAE